ncbi:BLUF domain-containing protein [Acinetobacter sp. ACNIH1]|uniref:BLUF domain-containing protein n=1 Tax=Acinetobacter sp. ACNIH1 TaxID=1636603 RepID=UPI000CDCA7AB|nr:BLUF domain-containing protein [Acinetobacter sp. ACNIH1]AUX90019.1 blue light sensor protein [Acinetobacter sp. ACNIH1]
MSDARLLYVSKLYDCADPMNDLFNILTEALNFNSRNAIFGALYYGNGYFVQCLEGDRNKIEDLFYKKILKDPRHKNCEVLYFEDVNDRLFSDWHMKYANIQQDILGFFAEHNLDEFNPYTLNAKTILQFIQILASLNDHAYTLKAS